MHKYFVHYNCFRSGYLKKSLVEAMNSKKYKAQPEK